MGKPLGESERNDWTPTCRAICISASRNADGGVFCGFARAPSSPEVSECGALGGVLLLPLSQGWLGAGWSRSSFSRSMLREGRVCLTSIDLRPSSRLKEALERSVLRRLFACPSSELSPPHPPSQGGVGPVAAGSSLGPLVKAHPLGIRPACSSRLPRSQTLCTSQPLGLCMALECTQQAEAFLQADQAPHSDHRCKHGTVQ
jgi:hypothetical protein